MPVPFGFGVSDFVAVGTLAWRVFLSCRAAPGVFGKISIELKSLHCVLEEAAETQLSQPLPPRRQARLKTILDGCYSILNDLDFIVTKYQSLGTDDKNPLDRLLLGNEDIAEIRSRLMVNITLLTAFRSLVLGAMTPEGLPQTTREYGSWQWVVELSGSEQGAGSPPRSIAPSISERSISTAKTDATTLVDVREVRSSPSPKAASRPRFGSFSSKLSSSKKRLLSAINSKNLTKALETLNDDSIAGALDPVTLDQALWSAALFNSTPLMYALLERGADINTVRDKKNVLQNAVTANNQEGAQFLLDHKVNLSIDHLHHTALPLRAALRSPSMMTLLARKGAPLDAEYTVSATIRYNILQEAVSQGREAIVRILLDNGATVDSCSSTSGTALMIALAMGREAIAKILIQRGANVNFTRTATPTCTYTNAIEAAILGRSPNLLDLVFRGGAVTDMPSALHFARANSEYPLIPSIGSQYGYDVDGTRKFFITMTMLAQRDLRYVLFFRKDDNIDVKRRGIQRMMNDLCKG